MEEHTRVLGSQKTEKRKDLNDTDRGKRMTWELYSLAGELNPGGSLQIVATQSSFMPSLDFEE